MNHRPQLKSKNYKLLKENKGVTLHYLGQGKDFLDLTQKHKQQKKK